MSKNNKTTTTALKLNYKQIFLIGFGFLASSLAWSIYNSQVPLILEKRFQLSGVLIGTIMTIDNFFGVIFQPLVGAASDRTRTRIGRRMPWIAVGIPICALFFSLAPLQNTLWAFMLSIIIFNLVMSLWRSPVISLMPDVTARPLRSKANGVINMMGGIGSILAFFFGGMLSDLREDKFYAFFMASVVMMIALFILLKYVREPDALTYREEYNLPIKDSTANRWAREAREELANDPHAKDEEEAEAGGGKKHSLAAFLNLPKAERRSLLFILLAVFSWFMGFNAIETFFTIFATNTYDISGGSATMMLAGFSLTFLVFAIPAGMLGQRIGRRRTILLGLIGIVLLFLPILARPQQWLVQALLIAGGICWAFININSLPMVLEFSSNKTVGTFTGYYYFFSFTSAIVSPILYGYIKDLLDSHAYLFAYSVICFALAFVFMLFVKHGDNLELAPESLQEA
ncbi:MAG: MFS transporter [Eubacteriales bacterium]|nr:MFS transporter [Eubacteriales bacterium]MDD4323577.1 MFS transporter [Eubacteriales bacterium]MDD4541082.1 MFS transporter [Eubacteriales bacterium]